MSKRKTGSQVGRRGFLKGAALAGAATTVAPLATARAQTQAPRQGKLPQGVSAIEKAVESGAIPAAAAPLVEATAGSDYMVDAFKSLGIEYIAATPGSSFRGLQESFVNYGKNQKPEWLTTTHEEASVAMSMGYAKVEGKPLLNLVHATVGLQHATMAIYNAYADRVPVLMITANIADATKRRPGVEADHTVQDGAVIVRDYTKWDDSPGSLQQFGESTIRAYQIAMTPPMGPVLLVADSELQEAPIPDDETLSIPKLPTFMTAAADGAAVTELAKMLVAAESPVVMADRGVPGPNGALPHLVELAELLQCPVVDSGARMNFPNQHPLSASDRRGAVLSQADLVVGFDMTDFYGDLHNYRDQLHRSSHPILKPGTKTVAVTSADQFMRSNYQNFQRFEPVDLEISGDSAATLPYLVEAVKRQVTAGHKSAWEARGKTLATARRASFARAKNDAAIGWDAQPISTARMCMELWEQIKDEEYSLVNGGLVGSYWPHRLWTMTKYYNFLGDSGAAGMGYGGPGSVGSALANRKYGRLSVSIVGDGDLMVSPGAIWTAVKHKIPIMFVVHNNRYYFQEVMHLERMATRRMRDPRTSRIGTEIAGPNIDYATMARSMGMHGFGPVTDPQKLGGVFKQAVDIVKQGQPVLIDVVAQGR